MPVTLNDIARKAGLSITTVSRVLNKKAKEYRINRETERLVLKTAREMNYRPNQLARSLRLKKSHTIGLVVPDISNPFFATIIRSVQTVAHTLGYSVVVRGTDEDIALEIEHVQLLHSKGVDGLIVMPVGQRFSHLETLHRSGVPMVIADRCSDELRTAAVSVDNSSGAYEAVEHLILSGHRRIAIIQGLPDTWTARGRLDGYRAAFGHYGIPIDDALIVGEDFRQQAGYVETKKLLAMEQRPTALFTTSDLITLGALQAIDEEKLSIPGDISLVAFDDLDGVTNFRCPITAIAQPKEIIGETAVSLLVDQIRGRLQGPPRRIVLRPKLISRESVRRLVPPETVLAAS